MSSNYDGIPDNVSTAAPLNIASTTDTSPISVTVVGSLPASFFVLAKPRVHIDGHPVNWNANGIWTATVTSTSSNASANISVNHK